MAMPLRWKAPPPGGGHPARHRRGGAAQPQVGFRAPSSRDWALTSAGTPGALTFSAATRSGMELGTGRHPLARSSANAGVPGQFLLRRRDDLRSWAHPAVALRPGRPDCSSSSFIDLELNPPAVVATVTGVGNDPYGLALVERDAN